MQQLRLLCELTQPDEKQQTVTVGERRNALMILMSGNENHTYPDMCILPDRRLRVRIASL